MWPRASACRLTHPKATHLQLSGHAAVHVSSHTQGENTCTTAGVCFRCRLFAMLLAWLTLIAWLRVDRACALPVSRGIGTYKVEYIYIYIYIYIFARLLLTFPVKAALW